MPWSIDASFTAIVFYGAGYLFKEKILFNSLINKKILFILVTCNILFGRANFWLNKYVDMFTGSYGNYFLFYLSAFTGIGAFFIIIKLIKRSVILQYIGRHSLIYLALHQGVTFSIITILLEYFLKDFSLILEKLSLLGVFYTIITLVTTIPIIYIISKYFPFMLGRKITFKKHHTIPKEA